MTVQRTVLNGQPHTTSTLNSILPNRLSIGTTNMNTFHFVRLRRLLRLTGGLHGITNLMTTTNLSHITIRQIQTPRRFLTFALSDTGRLQRIVTSLIHTRPHGRIRATQVIIQIRRISRTSRIFEIRTQTSFSPSQIIRTTRRFSINTIRLANTITSPRRIHQTVMMVINRTITTRRNFFMIRRRHFINDRRANFTRLQQTIRTTNTRRYRNFVSTVNRITMFLNRH